MTYLYIYLQMSTSLIYFFVHYAKLQEHFQAKYLIRFDFSIIFLWFKSLNNIFKAYAMLYFPDFFCQDVYRM